MILACCGLLLIPIAILIALFRNVDAFGILFFGVSFIVVLYQLRKITKGWLYVAVLPICLALSWVNYSLYGGVISELPISIIVSAWQLIIYLARQKPKELKIAMYCLLVTIIALTTLISLPKYTYTQACDKLAIELEFDNSQVGPGWLRTMGTVSATRPSIFVNRVYFLGAEAQGVVSNYVFDPVSGEWEEILFPNIWDVQEQDPQLEPWLDIQK